MCKVVLTLTKILFLPSNVQIYKTNLTREVHDIWSHRSIIVELI